VAIDQTWVVGTVLLSVAALDQLSKAWAWRHVPGTQIDQGGGLLVSPRYGSWYSGALTGSALDLVGLATLTVAIFGVVRRRRSPLVLAGAAVAVAGWVSNLADRLALHYWTAPHSRRGVVDFLHWDGRVWNLADLAIALGSVLALAGVLAGVLGSALGSAAARPGPRRRAPAVLVRDFLAGSRARGTAVAAAVTASLLAGVGALVTAGLAGSATLAAAR
jgi:lipoprotein signal peptidase